ncbi:MAG: MFS transporter [Acidobacteria bacterium]|nr:MFS transporter [Acidobacteriota bacterium]
MSERNKRAIRWGVLFLVSIVIASNYYVYDAMSSIKAVMQNELGISSTDYGLIVSFYSFPNTFLLMTVFGGIILDRFGIRKTGLLFTLLCALGAIFTAYGASDIFRSGGPGYAFFGSFLTGYSPELKLMILGRLLFGLGAETSIVVINKIVVRWFRGKELAFAFALNLAVARLGTALALILSPILIETETGWTTALWVAAVTMGVGFLFFIIYTVAETRLYEKPQASSLLTADERFNIRDIWALLKNKSFILISLLCVTFYSAVFPFQAFCPDFLHNKFGLSLALSGRLTSMIIWGTILFTPLFGLYVDRKGKRATLMLFGSGMLMLVHLTLSLTSITPYIAMFVLGIAFSLVPSAMWPAVARIVEEKRLGTAYGVMTSIQNLGLFAFPIAAGMITDYVNADTITRLLRSAANAVPFMPDMFILGTPLTFVIAFLQAHGLEPATLDYTYTILMFAGLGLIGFLFAFLLKREDAKSGSYNLELPELD